ncbi:MAG: type II/IV secretion system protein [Candidatus Kerfeldbacteria bacterium]|nr:type II/IV secretion system protein [Candidatus Kerfeldbacteria bacterium]
MPKTKKDEELVEEARVGGVIVQLVDTLVKQAMLNKASDIHIEPDQDKMRVRFRIDGILHEIGSHAISLLPSLVSRIKVLANLDISERRHPQDGRFQMMVGDTQVDFRISTFPTISGENVVMRLLDKGQIILGLEELGMNPRDLEKLNNFIHRLYGLVLVTGPNGSGKTTTLYSSINIINSIDKSIATLEDPVEYQLPLVRQTQVDPEARLSFAEGLRSLLRQDPDIIMVGEVRDRDTAGIAVQSALTGHLVLSTLHTNDAVGAVTRLIDMGIEPVLMAAATIGVIAQRLVRTICPNCIEQYTISAETATSMDIPKDATLYRGRGCGQCNDTGYKGRTGIFEVLTIDDTVRPLLIAKAPAERIINAARKQGMRSLREDGLEKALAGITTIEEVIRVTEARHPVEQDVERV